VSTNSVQVVVAYDFSPSAEQALSRAIDVAARAPQHVLHLAVALEPHVAMGPFHHLTYDDASRVSELAVQHVTKALQQRSTAGDVHFYVHTRIGKPADEILDLAREIGADLIFIGSHGKVGLERMLLGSVSERVVREARCPVMIARPKTYGEVQLLNVVDNDHNRRRFTPPHRYTYTNTQVIMRPAEWPIS
jgi:nucleotide-binding universal stress UspA family protein